MEVIKVNNEMGPRVPSFIALGNFDGIHRGHRILLENLVESARQHDVAASVLIFQEHTKNTIQNKKQGLLNSNKTKYKILKEIGIDIIYEMNFTKEVMGLDPVDFVKELLQSQLHVEGIVVGFDYRFGYKAKGDADLLTSLADELNLYVKIVPQISYKNEEISSTLIRKFIMMGFIEEANDYLGYPFTITGVVVPGKNLGKQIGFPTANIEPDVHYIIPKHGVYKTYIIIDGKKYLSATSIGTNPTFDEDEVKVETYIIDFDDDIYGREVELELVEYLRPMITFDSVDDLVKQMKEDVETVLRTS